MIRPYPLRSGHGTCRAGHDHPSPQTPETPLSPKPTRTSTKPSTRSGGGPNRPHPPKTRNPPGPATDASPKSPRKPPQPRPESCPPTPTSVTENLAVSLNGQRGVNGALRWVMERVPSQRMNGFSTTHRAGQRPVPLLLPTPTSTTL